MATISEPPTIASVVAVEGHPDDVELSAMGTLVKLHERGARVTIVSISDGGGGSFHDPSFRLHRSVRAGEASEVAARLDGEWLTLKASDGYVYDTPELRNELAAVMRNAECDLVLAPPPTDYHFDHTTAGQLAFSASYYAAVGGPRWWTPLSRTPPVFYFDSITGLEFEPSFFINISDQFKTKKELSGSIRASGEYEGDRRLGFGRVHRDRRPLPGASVGRGIRRGIPPARR